MMSRQRMYQAILVACIAGGVGVSIELMNRPTQPTRAAFNQIAVGMTREEIIQQIGPPRNYTSGRFTGCAEAWRSTGWVIREGELVVTFDEADIATQVQVLPVVVMYRPPFWERVQDTVMFWK